jgi:hypothetical protein
MLGVAGGVEPQSFKRTSWSKIIAAVNNGNPLGGSSAGDLQAILDGADTAEGSIQLRNNARPNKPRTITAGAKFNF